MVGGWDRLNADPLTTRAVRLARDRPSAIADGLLELLKIDEPTLNQKTTALVVAEYLHLSLLYLRSKFKQSPS